VKQRQLCETVPAALRAELAAREILRNEFAKTLGASHNWVYRRLNGQVDMTLRDLDRMAEALGVAPEQIVAAACGQLTSTGPDRPTGQGPLTPSPSAERNG
jgi:transcriptional regulator with XRE-family HTH domain